MGKAGISNTGFPVIGRVFIPLLHDYIVRQGEAEVSGQSARLKFSRKQGSIVLRRLCLDIAAQKVVQYSNSHFEYK